MNTTRRSFLGGLLAAPVVITTPKLLMPVKARVVEELQPTPFADALFNENALAQQFMTKANEIKREMELSYIKQLAADSKMQREWWTWNT